MSKLSKKQFVKFVQDTERYYQYNSNESFENHMLSIDMSQKPPCMTEKEYLMWVEMSYSCGSTCRTHTPCKDCAKDFMIEKIKEKKCKKLVIK